MVIGQVGTKSNKFAEHFIHVLCYFSCILVSQTLSILNQLRQAGSKEKEWVTQDSERFFDQYLVQYNNTS